MAEITEILRSMRDGVDGASERLMHLVYDDLRAMAAERMSRVPASDTLQPTALVHECYLRLAGKDDIEWCDRRHFYGFAARAMRDIIVEQARRHASIKRGGDRTRVSLDQADVGAAFNALDLIALADALEHLEAQDRLAAEVVMLRFFSGLSHEQTADALGIPVIKARREWQYAKAVLHKTLTQGEGG